MVAIKKCYLLIYGRRNSMLKPLMFCCGIGLGSMALSCCATAFSQVPEEVWVQLVAGQMQDLIVEFESDAIKQASLTVLPKETVEVLEDYKGLPLMLLRLRSAEALKALLANPAVVNVYQNQREKLLPAK
jgi:hypothetical protein